MNDIALNYEEKDSIDYGGLPVKCLLYCCRPGEHPFPLHWHRRMEILYIYSGTLYLVINGQPVTAGAGDTVCIRSRCPHDAVAGEEGVQYRVIMFETAPLTDGALPYTDRLRALATDSCRLVTLVQDKEAGREVEELVRLYLEENPSPLAVLGQLYRLLDWLLTHHTDQSYASHPADQRLWAVIDYIENHYTEALSTAGLAALFHYEEAYLCRRFRQQTGLSVLDYCHALRLNRSRRLLENTDLSITRIAADCGYDSVSYYIRKFSRQFGLTPAKWRHTYGEKGKTRTASAVGTGSAVSAPLPDRGGTL